MSDLPSPRRPWVQHVGLLTALMFLPACPGAPAADEDGGEGEDEGNEALHCTDPGSPLLDSAKQVGLPGPDALPFVCQSGWATDAPSLDATWTIALPSGQSNWRPLQVRAHPAGGAVVLGLGLFARYDADGNSMWEANAAASGEMLALLIEPAGTIVLSSAGWNSLATVTRYAADGSVIEPVAIPWNDNGRAWALETFADELVLGAFDTNSQGWQAPTFMRVDAEGNLLLRKSSGAVNVGALAIADDRTVAFGGFPSTLLALDNGAVLGNLLPSAGTTADVAALGDDFVTAGTANGMFTVGRYSSQGVERWLQTHDRAAVGGEFGQAIAVGPDGTLVAVGGTSQLDLGADDVWWLSGQPWVVGVDADGNALWTDRIATVGNADDVAIGVGGEVYVVGVAQWASRDRPAPEIHWLRRYDP